MGGDDNTSHWLSRSLLKLALFEGAADALPLLVNEDLRAHQREYLQLLGIPEARLLEVPRGQVIRCRELVVPTTLRNHPRMAAGLQWIRNRLGRLLAAENEAGDLLYASRRDAARRKMLNEADLEEALADLGFRVVVAPHGAALTNLIFAPRSAAAIEIATPSIAHMNALELFRRRGPRGRFRDTFYLSDATAVTAGADFRCPT